MGARCKSAWPAAAAPATTGRRGGSRNGAAGGKAARQQQQHLRGLLLALALAALLVTAASWQGCAGGGVLALPGLCGRAPPDEALPGWLRRHAFDAAAPINTTQLWQTSRNATLSPKAAAAAATWARHNPGLQQTLVDDAGAAAFVRSEFGADVAAVFASFPLGVMRADFWRYAVLYARGGVYADVDAECLAPIARWFPPRRPGEGDAPFVARAANKSWAPAGGLSLYNLTWSDCSFVVALENNAHLCQWTLAAAPGHPLLRETLRLIVGRAKAGFDLINPHLVHAHTGPAIFTEAARNVLGLRRGLSAAGIARAVWTEPAAYRRARALGVCVLPDYFFGAGRPQNARNLYGSQSFEAAAFPSWIQEAGRLREVAANASGGGGSSSVWSWVTG